jgi:hypothetical protein
MQCSLQSICRRMTANAARSGANPRIGKDLRGGMAVAEETPNPQCLEIPDDL